MKICLVVNNVNVNNGGGRFVRDFIASFEGSNVQFDVVAFNPALAPHTFSLTVLRPAWWRIFANIRVLRDVVRRCDVVHSFDILPNALYAAAALVGLNKQHVITAIGSSSVSPMESFFLRPLSAWVASSASKIIAISRHTARLMNAKIPTLKISIILPFLSPTWGVSCVSPKEEFMREVNTRRPFVLSVISRIKPRKGCIQNIRAFARAHKKIPELRYIMVATIDDTSYARAVVDEIKSLGLEEVVWITGNVSDDELCWLYANAKAHIMLSVYDRVNHDVEGFGLVYLEAACYGVWSVGTDDSGAIDAISQGKSGYILHAGDEGKLVVDAADALARIVQSPEPGAAMSAKNFCDSFSPQRSADAYIALYQKCTGGANKPA